MKEIRGPAEFEGILQSSERKLVCVDVTASWCGPCKMIAPVFASLAHTYGAEGIFLKVDGDANRELVQTLGVQGFPTIIFFRQGKEIDRMVGADTSKLERLVKQHLVPPPPPEPRPPFSLLPEKRMQLNGGPGKLFRAASKLEQINQGRLTNEELGDITRIAKALDSKASRIEKVAPSLKGFAKVLKEWPLDQRFAACDILRVLAATLDGAEAIALMRGTALDVTAPLLAMASGEEMPASKLGAVAIAMSIDAISNCFYQEKGQPVAVTLSPPADCIENSIALFPAAALSYANLVLNRAVLATRLRLPALLGASCREVVKAFQVQSVSSNQDACLRILMAAGSLFWTYHLLINFHGRNDVPADDAILLTSIQFPDVTEGKLVKVIEDVQAAFKLPL